MLFAYLFLLCQKLLPASLLLFVSVSGFVNEPEKKTVNNDPNAPATTTAAAAKATTLRGIDVSRWQLTVDWDQVKEAEITFAFVKATQGNVRPDPYFTRNWAETKRVGIKRGPYHFYMPDASPLEQATLFKNTVWLEAGDLPPVLDVEVFYPDMDVHEFRKNLHIWLEEIHKHYGFKPIIYTYQAFYRRYLKGYFNDYPFWIARYSNEQPDIHEEDKWLFWQYSDKGSIPGITQDVDLNTFPGDLEKLQSLCLPELQHTEQTPPLLLRNMHPLP